MRHPNIIIPVLMAAMMTGIASCADKECAVPEHISPLYKDFAYYRTLSDEQKDSLINTDKTELGIFLEAIGLDTVNDATMTEWSYQLPNAVFFPAVDSVFPKLEPLEQTLGRILANAKNNKIELPKRRYAAIIWGKYKTILLSDSCMLIALNHYLGADYPGYSHWAGYMRLEKTPERLPYDIAEALTATQYPYDNQGENTVLSRILYEGALTLAKEKLVPDGTLGGALHYSDLQLKWLADNESDLWKSLIEKEMLYDMSELTADKLVNPAPNTAILKEFTPPRAGRYIGYRIVRKYMESHKDITIPELLSPSFYKNESVLIESGYTGS